MIKKRQHYIAQSYLRNFSPTKDYLYVFSFWQKRCSRNHIKNICKEDYFYGNDAIAQDFENNLSVIENKHKKLIDKILNNFSLDNLSDDEYLGLLVFMLFQAARTKTSKKNSRIIAKIIEQKNQNQDIVDFDMFQEMPRKINNGDYQFRRDFAITMHSAINSVEAITDLKPVLLVNISDRNFICGDAPIVIFNNIKFSNHSSDGDRKSVV